MPALFPDFSCRTTDPEIMDGNDYTPEELRSAYNDLCRVNEFLGGASAILGHLIPELRAAPSRPVTVLDVGTGSADIPRALVRMARRESIDVRVVALDLNPYAIESAMESSSDFPEIAFVQAGGLLLPFDDDSFDLVLASELLHHLPLEVGASFLLHLHRVCRVAFVINDLRRHPIPYYTFWALSRLFTQNRIIRHDGLVSILRGFTPEDINHLAQMSHLHHLSVHYHFPFRIVLVGKKGAAIG